MNFFRNVLETYWTYAVCAILLLVTFNYGIHVGETKIQRAWDFERHQIAVVQAKQEQIVKDVHLAQQKINQEISDEFISRSKILAFRKPDPDIWMRDSSAAVAMDVPTLSDASAGVDGAGSNKLLDQGNHQQQMTCNQIIEDSMKSTLMLIELQKWINAVRATVSR